MCGLVGIASVQALNKDEKDLFKELLFIDTVRGDDSTGVFSVNPKNYVHWLKNAISAPYFISGKDFDKHCMTSSLKLLAGHNRKATMGAVDTGNAHPFTHGDITLMHNGTLRSIHPLVKDNKIDTDSEHICKYLSEVPPDEAEKVISKLNGAFALVWWDERDNTLNLIRNTERTLYVAMDSKKKVKTMIWASEENMIRMAAKGRYTVSERVKVETMDLLKPMRHYKMSIKGKTIRAVSMKDYEEYTSTYVRKTYNLGGNTVKKIPTGTAPVVISGQGNSGKTTSTLSDETKKVASLFPDLPSYAPSPGDTIEVMPIMFSRYSYNRPGTPSPQEEGRVTCLYTLRGKYLEVEINNKTRSTYEVWDRMEVCWLNVRIRNIAPDRTLDQGFVIYATVEGLSDDCVLEKDDVLDKGREVVTGKKDELDNIRDLTDKEMEDTYSYVTGPSNTMIPIREFKEKVKHGCANCTTGFGLVDAAKIHWENEQTPLCPDCAELREAGEA